MRSSQIPCRPRPFRAPGVALLIGLLGLSAVASQGQEACGGLEIPASLLKGQCFERLDCLGSSRADLDARKAPGTALLDEDVALFAEGDRIVGAFLREEGEHRRVVWAYVDELVLELEDETAFAQAREAIRSSCEGVSGWLLKSLDVEAACGQGAQEELTILRPGKKLAPSRELAMAYLDLLACARKAPGVRSVQPDLLYTIAGQPSDPSFRAQWPLSGIGPVGSALQQAPTAQIGAQSAWVSATGSSEVVVAVVDTGIDTSSQASELISSLWTNLNERRDRTDSDANGYADDLHGWDFQGMDNDPNDENGHGTQCSGVVGARWDDYGIAGLNEHVSLMPVRVFDQNGCGTTRQATCGIRYALQMGAKVISCSWGGPEPADVLEEAVRAAEGKALIVAAAGNDAEDRDAVPFYPASYRLAHVISTGASDFRDDPWLGAHGEHCVDLSAPGVGILTTQKGLGNTWATGTSMSTAFVAGAAALVLSENPDVTPSDLRRRLLEGTDRRDALSSTSCSGGRLNVDHAVKGVLSNPGRERCPHLGVSPSGVACPGSPESLPRRPSSKGPGLE